MTKHRRPAWQMPPGLPQTADDTWTYVLDDHGISYGPGWWPFHADRSATQASLPTDRTPAPCGVRLAPDVAFYAWHTEYILLYPTDETSVVAGSCSIVPDDMPRHDAYRVAFQLRRAGDDWVAEQIGPATRGQDILAEKTRRAIDFLRHAIAERDASTDQPTTAHDLRGRKDAAANHDSNARDHTDIAAAAPRRRRQR